MDIKVIAKGALKVIMGIGGVAATVTQVAGAVDAVTNYSKNKANADLDALIDAKLNERMGVKETAKEVETQ